MQFNVTDYENVKNIKRRSKIIGKGLGEEKRNLKMYEICRKIRFGESRIEQE